MQVTAECKCKMKTSWKFLQVCHCQAKRTFRATCISKEIEELLENGDVVLGKDICIKPNLLSFADDSAQESSSDPWQNPVPPADMLKFASLARLGTLLVMKAKKLQYFLIKSVGNRSDIGVPSLQKKRPALVKSFKPAPGLSFCFLACLSQAGVLGGDTSAIVVSAVETHSPIQAAAIPLIDL